MNTFKDHFSKQAEIYVQYRPTYPKELFDYLAALTPQHDLAWDCGTGNGQSAVQLTAYFDQVYATDPSEKQINHAIQHEQVSYQVESAEKSGLKDFSADLITVAQAVHWFDFDLFYAEVKRVLKPDGIIAVWAYGVPSVSETLDPLIRNFHDNVVGEFWQKENRMIDDEYQNLPFPFQAISAPEFYIRKHWTRKELLGHFATWSATQKSRDKYGKDPVEALENELAKCWIDENEVKEVSWKLILKVGKQK
jgi:ubiquinone/menaquinone biosynthesis C-methylase UbiE